MKLLQSNVLGGNKLNCFKAMQVLGSPTQILICHDYNRVLIFDSYQSGFSFILIWEQLSWKLSPEAMPSLDNLKVFMLYPVPVLLSHILTSFLSIFW